MPNAPRSQASDLPPGSATSSYGNPAIGDCAPGQDTAEARNDRPLSRDDWLEAYRRMLLIRRFEERAGQLFGLGLIGGYCHLCIGREAVVVGLRFAAEPGDPLVASERCHGHLLAAGVPAAAAMAELMGRATGISGGKGGSQNLFARQHAFFGGYGRGAAAPVGAGLALAQTVRTGGGVVWAICDGADADHGQFGEALRLAAHWSLPIVLVIENDSATGDGAAAPVEGPSGGFRSCGLAGRGVAFGVPGEQVDGMDIGSVREAAVRAARRARAGQGPTLIETITCRYRGHAMADAARTSAQPTSREELQRLRERTDPLEGLKGRLVRGGLASASELAAIEAEVRASVSAAVEHARAAPEPEAGALDRDVATPCLASACPMP